MLASMHFREDVVPTPTEPAVETSVPVASDPRLPEGEYRTAELTRDQLIAAGVAAGFDEADVAAFIDGGDAIVESAAFQLRLEDGTWTQLSSLNGGPFGIGWFGTYEVVDDDTVVATDPASVITYDYAFDGQTLILDMVDDQCPPCGEDMSGELMAQTTIFESAPFMLSGQQDAVDTTVPGAAVTPPSTT